VRLLPDTTLDQTEHRHFDMVALPGGLPGADHLAADPRIRRRLQATSQAGGYTAAICAAPRVLAEAGLLEGRTATAYPGVLDRLDLADTRLSAAAVVLDGTVVTSRGPGTAMDFALTLVEVLAGRAKREEVEAGLVRDR
jgi:4-methyl-5(b-hydroxyethyl)-thiazole monophosphate biosynthesis